MQSTKYGIPIFEDEDIADLNNYSEKMADAIEKQIDKFGSPLCYIGEVTTYEGLNNIPNVKNGEICTVLDENKNYIFNGTSWIEYSNQINLEKVELSKVYKASNITAKTIEGTGKIHKLFGKTEETGEGEKSPSNPYEIICIGNDINLFNKNATDIVNERLVSRFLNGAEVVSKDYVATGFIPVEENQKYIVSGNYDNAGEASYCFYDEHKMFISGTGLTTLGAINTILVVPQNAKYLRMSIEKTALDTTKLQKGEIATTYSKYREGTVKIISKKEKTEFLKEITCKPLCCLKDNEGNIIAQDYIDFDRQKIHRECGYIEAYKSEDIQGIYISSTGGLTEGAIVVYELSNATEEDIECTCGITQYEGETTIYNTEGAELEVELTNNKAISSANESIVNLQREKLNKLKNERIKITIDSKYIGKTDLNQVIKHGNICRVDLRGEVIEDIPNSTTFAILPFLPELSITFMFGLGGHYTINTPKWGFAGPEGEIQSNPITKGQYIHISFTYICKD